MKKYLLSLTLLYFVQHASAQEVVPPPEPIRAPEVIQQPVVQQPVVQEPVAQPSTEKRPQNPRRGFFLGLGLGGGGIHVNNGFDRGAALGGLRIGGGINEKVLLMAESFAAVTEQGGVTTSLGTLNFSAQVFLAENFYIRPGLGFSVMDSSVTKGPTTTTTTSDTGFSSLLAAGYEFRIGRIFALSPEAQVNYNRVDGFDVVNYGAILGLIFYFK